MSREYVHIYTRRRCPKNRALILDSLENKIGPSQEFSPSGTLSKAGHSQLSLSHQVVCGIDP